MKVFLAAGLLYLVCIAVILLVKPSFMFREDGSWKEFGIGRDPKDYTFMPFWLYCILSAMVSYIVTLFLFRIGGVPSKVAMNTETNVSTKPKLRRGSTMPEGYYVLSKPPAAGQPPTYIYIGEDVVSD